jgi:hypothetical protein
MRELILKQFFDGSISGVELAFDLQDALVADGPVMTHHLIQDMDEEFEVLPEHLVKACSAVLEGGIPEQSLAAIGFCLVASDSFYWNSDTEKGDLVANVVYDWASPETNYPLTTSNIKHWRQMLLGQPHELAPK